MILVDSSVWIDYFRGDLSAHADTLDQLLGNEPLLVGDLILAEVLQGFGSGRDFNQARRLLESFEIVSIGGHATAVQAARNYRALRSRGITVRKTIDMFIATYCIEADLDLLFGDRDFDPFVQYLGLRAVT